MPWFGRWWPGWAWGFYPWWPPRWWAYGAWPFQPYAASPWGVSPWGAYPPVVAPEAELSALRDQAQWLKEQLDAINERIEELEKEE